MVLPERARKTYRIGNVPLICPARRSVFICLVMKKLKLRIEPSECSTLSSADPTPPRGSLREIRHRPDRLERAQHIGRRLGIERVGIEEVRTAEHVEHGRPRRGQIGVCPGPDLRKLALLELPERGIEEACVALPGRVLGQRRQRRFRRRRHAGKEARGIVGGHGVGGARRQPRARGSRRQRSAAIFMADEAFLFAAWRMRPRRPDRAACGKRHKSKGPKS